MARYGRPVGQAGYAAVVLAGGSARRLGGVLKPALPVGGRPMLERVLAAVTDAVPRVVVGPPELRVPAGVLVTREEPPGGGPVAGTAAGLALVPERGVAQVALFAADLPLLDAGAVAVLRAALGTADVALFVDDGGRRQSMCAIWRAGALRSGLRRLAGSPEGLSGVPMRALLDGPAVAEVGWTGAGPPPWFDCDTDADLRRAEEWTDERT